MAAYLLSISAVIAAVLVHMCFALVVAVQIPSARDSLFCAVCAAVVLAVVGYVVGSAVVADHRYRC